MMRLIDADELLKSAVCLDGVCNVSVVGVDDIGNAPTIDLESLRPHGEWHRTTSDYECSKCQYPMDYITPYCPNCGAEMGGAEDE